VRTVPGAVGSTPEKDPRKVFIGGKWAVGTPGMECLSEGIQTHTIKTPRSRAHIKAEISRLENNFGCLGKLVYSLGSNCYLTPLLMMPLLTGVKMAGFTHRLGFEIKISQIFYFPQNFTLYLIFYPVFSLKNPAVPGCSTQILPPFRL
jgi:hypothetical protein